VTGRWAGLRTYVWRISFDTLEQVRVALLFALGFAGRERIGWAVLETSPRLVPMLMEL
jgi:hypothetical protein